MHMEVAKNKLKIKKKTERSKSETQLSKKPTE